MLGATIDSLLRQFTELPLLLVQRLHGTLLVLRLFDDAASNSAQN
jgi:hypothetical protein